MANKERTYSIDVRDCYPEYEEFHNTQKKFGYFSEDGASYTIFDGKTPRPWINMLYNDKFASAIANRGEGFTVLGRFYNRITRYFDPELYLPRNLDGKRTLEILDDETGEIMNLFDANYSKCRVTPGCSEFFGEISGIEFCVKVFVPLNDPCECWIVELKNKGGYERKLTVHAEQIWAFYNNSTRGGSRDTCRNLKIEYVEKGIEATAFGATIPYDTIYSAFAIENCTNSYNRSRPEHTLTTSRRFPAVYKEFNYNHANLFSSVVLGVGESAKRTVVSTASDISEEAHDAVEKYTVSENAEAALREVAEHWKKLTSYNTCSLPDKNMERFLNIWLKYQLGLTYIYNRGESGGGFRDVTQDCWGAMLIHPEYPMRRMREALSHVYPDGHSMRVYDGGERINKLDFVDCPLWMPCTVAQYIKETGDYKFMDEVLPYYESDEKGTVEEHMWRMLDNAYRQRGENGLVLMRDGDWLDGLADSINLNGKATSAWATMEAFWAQRILAELYEAMGENEKAAELRRRNEEYRTAVREVAWDGKWYLYGFKSDGQPIGSSKCPEGKIYLNPQSWAMLSGIETDPARIKTILRSVDTYLTTPFGPALLYPPYVHDRSCGRISTQVPGSFANGAIYLHGASFKVYGDIAAGEYDRAYDVWSRLIPNHPDNPDCRRTSEPFCTGNVHFGPHSPRYGMNLFSWFTATPAWLIHGGFDAILGVEAGYDGLHVSPRVPEDWNEYSVNRLYRGRQYQLNMRRANDGEIKGIYADGKKIADSVIPLDCTADKFEILY